MPEALVTALPVTCQLLAVSVPLSRQTPPPRLAATFKDTEPPTNDTVCGVPTYTPPPALSPVTIVLPVTWQLSNCGEPPPTYTPPPRRQPVFSETVHPTKRGLPLATLTPPPNDPQELPVITQFNNVGLDAST